MELIKGPSVRIFDNFALTTVATQSPTDKAVDCRGYNAVHVEVFGAGVASLVLQGSADAGGSYLTLPDASATQALTANTSFDCVVGSAWLKGQLTVTSGTWTIIVTPYVSPGTTVISVTGTPDQNLSEYGGSAVGAGNAVHVQPGTSASFVTTLANGQPVALGSTTDAAASATTDEDGTARTGIGLFKGIKNILLDLKGLLAGGLPAALGSGGGLKVDGSGTALPVSGTVAATMADGQPVAFGTTTDAAASPSADEDGTARTGIGLLKGAKNILIDLVGLLNGGLPAALAAGGGLKVEGVAGGVAQPVSLQGTQVTLLAETTITTDTTTNVAAVTGLDEYTQATVLLTIASKTMDASTTLDLYLQYSPDGGTTWDDLAHFAQVTSAAIANGTYVMSLNSNGAPSAVDRATTDGTLAANTIRDVSWCDRIRVKRVSTNFAGSDTITVTLTAYMQQ